MIAKMHSRRREKIDINLRSILCRERTKNNRQRLKQVQMQEKSEFLECITAKMHSQNKN